MSSLNAIVLLPLVSLLLSVSCHASVDHIKPLFTSVASENMNAKLDVVGVIPSYVEGNLWKNGFGKFEGANFEFNYLFDVMSQIVRVSISPSSGVSLSNRLLSSSYLNTSNTKIPPYRTFGGTDPDMDALTKIETLPHATSDNLNVNIIRMGEKLVAISDMAGEMIIDEETLDAKGLYPWSDSVASVFSMITSAHPSALPSAPSVLYSYHAQVLGNFPHIGKLHKYQVYRLDTSKPEPYTRSVFAEIDIQYVPYVHSFALTNNFITFVEFPLMWDITHIATTVDPILTSMNWKPTVNNGTRILVIDLATGNITRTLYTDPFFAYHHINAFEQDGEVVFDICAYPDNTHMQAFQLSTLKYGNYSIPSGTVRRFFVPVADLSDSTVRSQNIGTVSMDLPSVNDKFRGLPYRFSYGTGDASAGVWWNSLVKLDMETGVTKVWYTENHWPTEPIFVADPSASPDREDDGVLLSIVLDASDLSQPFSYLLVLNATDMSVLATADFPVALPYTSHGFFDVKRKTTPAPASSSSSVTMPTATSEIKVAVE